MSVPQVGAQYQACYAHGVQKYDLQGLCQSWSYPTKEPHPISTPTLTTNHFPYC